MYNIHDYIKYIATQTYFVCKTKMQEVLIFAYFDISDRHNGHARC